MNLKQQLHNKILIASFKTLLGLILLVIVAAIGWQLVKLDQVLESGTPFVRHDEDAQHRVLVLGDSTGVGTGADNPDNSLAGKLSAYLNGAHVENYAQNGLTTKELAMMLEGGLLADTHFDIVLVHIGANDILRFVPLEDMHTHMTTILEEVVPHADTVVLIHGGNVGVVPLITWPLSTLYENRTRAVRDMYREFARQYTSVQYLDLFTERNDPQTVDFKYLFAEDNVHPNADGYALWFETLLEADILPTE